MDGQAYTADASLKGKLRRRLVRLATRRPARLSLTRPMVSFTFDDAPATAAHAGAAVLEERGLRGAFYVAAGLAGQQGVVGRYASAEEMLAVEARGHELACHTYSHLDCGQASPSQIAADVARNAEALRAWGAKPLTNFAYPYGDVSLGAKTLLGPRYDVLRALHAGLIRTGADLNQAPAVGIEGPGGLDHALTWLRRAAEQKAWLLLYTHDVCEDPSIWGCTPEALRGAVGAAMDLGFEVVTVAEGARRLQAG